ncbi:hypothetical protein INT48_000200, partial [Thamnidium elegans]
MNDNVFDEFAKIVKSYSCTTDASDVAKQYVEKTWFEQSKPSDFMFCENNTWELIYNLTNVHNCSELEKYATIREWISKIPIDSNLLEKVRELEIINQELDDEFNVLLRRNRMLRPHKDERPKKIRRISNTMEPLYKERFQRLRDGQLEPVSGNTTLDYVYNEYIKFNRAALEKKNPFEINIKERSTWKDCVKHMSNDDNLGEYGKALFYTLCGNVTDLCESMGKTWEDIIWTYLNGKVEQALDNTTTRHINNIVLRDKDIMELALEKDDIMDRDDPRILFHQIQIAILSNTVPDLMQRLYQGFVKNVWDSKLAVSKAHYAQVLRFVSTLILFGREYLGWAEDPQSTALLTSYAELNAQPSTFRPVVIASYAAKLAPKDQIRVFSEFLENFDGDTQECEIICRLGKELGLDMRNILITTSKNIMTKAFKKTIPFSTTFEVIPTQQNDNQYDIFFSSIQWLLLDKSLCLNVIKSANEAILYFFTYRKIYLVERMIDMVPEWVYEQLALDGKLDNHAIIEFDLNRKVMLLFTNYHEWQTLIGSEPKDSGSLEDLRAIYAWRDELERKTLKMEDRMLDVLEGNWLRGASIVKDRASSVAIRQLYIPEILIRYHNLLYSTASIVPANENRSAGLVNYVTNEHKELFDDITGSKSWDKVIQEF